MSDNETTFSYTGSHFEDNIEKVNESINSAEQAFEVYSRHSDSKRVTFLRQIIEELMSVQEEIIKTAMQETGLPEPRLINELDRTTNQLEQFSALLDKGDWVKAVIESPEDESVSANQPDLRMMQIPLGPVAVFGASNFPLAFSVAGGDTASALAAACTVVFKAHPGHPRTSNVVANAIDKALKKCELPSGVFSIVHSSLPELSQMLVRHPHIKAVGFTGSTHVGRQLYNVACSRDCPIPFFGELGSSNPVVLMPNKLNEDHTNLAQGLIDSFTLGVGQFCTKPGLIVAIKGEGLELFKQDLHNLVAECSSNVMLTPGIKNNYLHGLNNVMQNPGISVLATKEFKDESYVPVTIFKVEGSDYLNNPKLEEEVFGPAIILIECDDVAQVEKISRSFSGHLTATIHHNENDQSKIFNILNILKNKVGRIISNGWPTGVLVSDAMCHGGPYPASTDSRFTSVGTGAIKRFTRPQSYQNVPDELLPVQLRNKNPSKIIRRINGRYTKKSLLENH